MRKRKLDLDIAEREVRLKQSQVDVEQSQVNVEQSQVDVKQSQMDARRCDVDLQLYFKSLLRSDAEVMVAMNANIKKIAMNMYVEKSSPFFA